MGRRVRLLLIEISPSAPAALMVPLIRQYGRCSIP